MQKTIQAIEWKRSDDETPTDVTDAIEEGVVSATPHPDDEIDRPKGYSLKLILKPDSNAFAAELQEALLDVEPAIVRLRLDGVDESISNVPVNVSKVPYPGDQNVAEMGVPPDGHDRLHPHFGEDLS